jgi:hypothetical protein
VNHALARPLLNMTYTDVNKNHPDFQTKHESVLKKVDVRLTSVLINFHQDAIMDLVDKVTKFISELSSNAKILMATATAATGNTPMHIGASAFSRQGRKKFANFFSIFSRDLSSVTPLWVQFRFKTLYREADTH